MKEVRFSIEIQAPKEQVWRTLWQDKTFREWAGIIDPGTYMMGDLEKGNEVEFISSENGYGVTSLIAEVTTNELLLLKHQSDTQNTGTEKRDKEWTGGTEKYTLSETKGITTLEVFIDVPINLEQYFKETYPKAFERV